MILLKKKLEYYKINSIIKNKFNFISNKNLNFYIKYYIIYEKKNFKCLNIMYLLKYLKNIISFTIYNIINYSIFIVINDIKPGIFTNKNNVKNKIKINYIFPNNVIFFDNDIFNNNNKIILKDNDIQNINNYGFFFNELAKLKIFSININNNNNFYTLINKNDFFIPLNIKNINKFYLLNIFIFCEKFSKIFKYIFLIKKQKIYNNIYKKLYNKNTHYWTRTNTLKKTKNRF